MVKKVSPRSSNPGGDIRSIFRPFNMNAMDDVRFENLFSVPSSVRAMVGEAG